MAEQLVHTFQLLQSLQCSSSEGSEINASFMESLAHAMLQDGVTLPSIVADQNLRRLEEEYPTDANDIIINLIPVIICVMCAAFASGLTQGLLALDFMEMKIKSQSGTPKEKEYANKVIPIIKNHHLLLCSLMLWNASATEALPIFLNKLVPEFISIIISVTLVLIVGEIIPASILTGPQQLKLAANLTPLVYCVLVFFFPIAYPLSILLDKLIGHDEGVTMYSRREIVTLMRIQHEEGMRRTDNDIRDTMNHEEVNIIGGALTFRDQIVSNVMTPLNSVFMVHLNDKLSYETVYNIFKAGYSRIPVYDKDRNDIVSLILAKDLIFVDPEDDIPISNFVDMFGRRPIFVWHDDKLGETLSTFRHERAHLALVRDVENQCEGDPFYKVVGLITLEDIIEEILGTEIEDETDFTSDAGNSSPLRDIDLARLKSLSSKITDETLSADEIEAIANYLDDNVPEIHEVIKGGKEALKALVQKSGVLTLKKKTPPGEKAHHEDYIFRKGKVSNTCIVVLQGRVRVIKGDKDEVEEMKGPWTTIAAEALSVKEGTFIPDFSACIESEYLRFVRITTFQEAKNTSDGWSNRSKLQKLRSHNTLVGSARAGSPPANQFVIAPSHHRTIYTSPLKRRATHNIFDPSTLPGSEFSDPAQPSHLQQRDSTGRSISTGGLVTKSRAIPVSNKPAASQLASMFNAMASEVGVKNSSDDSRPLLSAVDNLATADEDGDEVASKASAVSDGDISRNVRFDIV